MYFVLTVTALRAISDVLRAYCNGTLRAYCNGPAGH